MPALLVAKVVNSRIVSAMNGSIGPFEASAQAGNSIATVGSSARISATRACRLSEPTIHRISVAPMSVAAPIRPAWSITCDRPASEVS